MGVVWFNNLPRPTSAVCVGIIGKFIILRKAIHSALIHVTHKLSTRHWHILHNWLIHLQTWTKWNRNYSMICSERCDEKEEEDGEEKIEWNREWNFVCVLLSVDYRRLNSSHFIPFFSNHSYYWPSFFINLPVNTDSAIQYHFAISELASFCIRLWLGNRLWNRSGDICIAITYAMGMRSLDGIMACCCRWYISIL